MRKEPPKTIRIAFSKANASQPKIKTRLSYPKGVLAWQPGLLTTFWHYSGAIRPKRLA